MITVQLTVETRATKKLTDSKGSIEKAYLKNIRKRKLKFKFRYALNIK